MPDTNLACRLRRHRPGTEAARAADDRTVTVVKEPALRRPAAQRPLTVDVLARHPQLPAAAFGPLVDATLRLPGRHAAETVATLITNPSAPAAFVDRYADDRRTVVRLAVAAATCDPQLLATFAAADVPRLRAAAAANPATGTGTLAQLTGDRSPQVWSAALANRACPAAAAEARSRTVTGDELAAVPQQRHRERHYVTYAKLAHLPAVARTLACMADAPARAAAVVNPAAFADDRTRVQQLAKDGSVAVRRAVATDPAFAVDDGWLSVAHRQVRHEVERWRDGATLTAAAAAGDRTTAIGFASDAVDRALAATVSPSGAARELHTLVRRSRTSGPDGGAPLPPPSATVIATYIAAAVHGQPSETETVARLLEGPYVGNDRVNAVGDLVVLRHLYRSDADVLSRQLGDDTGAWRTALALLDGWHGPVSGLAAAARRLSHT